MLSTLLEESFSRGELAADMVAEALHTGNKAALIRWGVRETTHHKVLEAYDIKIRNSELPSNYSNKRKYRK